MCVVRYGTAADGSILINAVFASDKTAQSIVSGAEGRI